MVEIFPPINPPLPPFNKGGMGGFETHLLEKKPLQKMKRLLEFTDWSEDPIIPLSLRSPTI